MTTKEIYALPVDENGWRTFPNGNRVKIGPGAEIGPDVVIGEGSEIGAGSVIGGSARGR